MRRDSRPNIVVFIPDQLRADALGCFGNEVASTPNIDALAASGTRFTQAWGQHPFCSQSRTSFLTGWYPHVWGHRSLYTLLKSDQPDALRVLKESGYHVAHAGLRGDTWAPGRTKESTSRFGWTIPPATLFGVSPYGPDHRFGRAFYHGRRDGDPVLDFDEATVRTAEEWLAEGLPEPWVLYLPLVLPHPPFEAQEPWFSMVDRNDVPLPRAKADDGEPLFKAEIRKRYGTDRLDEDDWREIIATYYGMVSRIDAHLGRVLDAVDRAGSTERTAVLFFPDHGEYLGDDGLVEKWVSGMDPALLHNPLIARVPDGPEGLVCDALVGLLDVAPTLCELGAVEPGYTHFGNSLVDLALGRAQTHRKAVFSEGGLSLVDARAEPPAPFPYDLKHGLMSEVPKTAGRVITMRTAEWTYVHRTYEGDELYDRRSDPDEHRNVIAEASSTTVVSDLRSAMLDWLAETSDVLPAPDPRQDLDGALGAEALPGG